MLAAMQLKRQCGVGLAVDDNDASAIIVDANVAALCQRASASVKYTVTATPTAVTLLSSATSTPVLGFTVAPILKDRNYE
jgi:hypothetical protein